MKETEYAWRFRTRPWKLTFVDQPGRYTSNNTHPVAEPLPAPRVGSSFLRLCTEFEGVKRIRVEATANCVVYIDLELRGVGRRGWRVGRLHQHSSV